MAVHDALGFATLAETSRLLRTRQLSSEELTRALIERTEALEPRLNSYIRFMPDEALAQARAADARHARQMALGPLDGVPFTLKDLFDVEGVATTAGARFLAGQMATTDSVVMRRLRAAGGVLLGKANLNKFAGGDSGDNPDYGRIRNPWNAEFSAGGSSGGSGSQVAAGLVPLSLGTDNGGSVRIPAAVCGVVGFKPTYGRISMEGVFPRAYSFDHVGPLTRTVEDCAIALQVLAGHESGDGTTLPREVPVYRATLDAGLQGVRVGVDPEFANLGQPSVLESFSEAVDVLRGIGADIREVHIPGVDDLHALALALLFDVEWTAAHEPWLRDRPSEYPAEWNPRAGFVIPAVEYVKAMRFRRELQLRYARATAEVEVLISPTYPFESRPFDGYPSIDARQGTFEDALRYTWPFDVFGLPAISVPCGFSSGGFPIGLQIVGRAFDEPTVLRVAHAYEQAAGWYQRHPTL